MGTKYYSDKNPWNKPTDTPITLGEEEWYAESRPTYICDFCHHTLIKLSDRSGINISWYCNNCNTEYDPETELRSKTPLTMAEGPVTNPSVSYAPERTIKRRKTEPRGSFKVLRERGVNIVNYKETGWRKEKEDYD
jgi:ribosomal protein L37AE/L43A